MLNSTLEETTDYEEVVLKQGEYRELKDRCVDLTSEKDIEYVINKYLGELGYLYNDKACKWKLINF